MRNPVFSNLLLLVMLIGGIITYRSMTREVFPEVPLDMILIRTVYTNAPPEEVEKQITIPIENSIENIENVESVASQSYESVSIVEVKVRQGTQDLQKMVNDIKTEIEQIENYPDDAEEPRVIEVKSQIPVIGVSVSGDIPEVARRKVTEELKNRLMRIDGVASLQISGLRDIEIWVEADPLRLNALGISVNQIANAIGDANVSLPAGNIEGVRQEFPLRTPEKLKRPGDVKRVIIKRGAAGRSIRVEDVAQVTETFEEEESFGRVDGENAMTLIVMKSQSGNTIEITNEARRIIAGMQKELPEKVTLKAYQDSSRYIRQRLKTLYKSGAIGLVLVCLVLFAFLNWRMALWTALGIPASFLGAFLLMDQFGITINMMSLFSMILVLGMVVDDAIIVSENVYRYLLMGYPSGRAAVMGTMEVVMPVTAAITTTVAAFLPMLMMTGIMGKFISTIPIVVSITLFMSMIEAFFILPSHLADFSASSKKPLEKESTWFKKVRRIYRKIIKTMLRHRYISLAGAILLVLGTLFYAYTRMNFVMFKPKDLVGFLVKLEMPVGTRLEETGNVLRQVEKIASSLPKEDVEAAVSMIGTTLDYSTGRVTFGSHVAQTLFESTEFDTRGRRNGYTVADEVRQKLKTVTGARSLEVKELGGGPPVGAALEARISGDDYGTLTELTRLLKEYLKSISGVVDVKDNYTQGKTEIHLKPDTQKLSLMNLNEARIATAVRSYFDGRVATTIKRGKDDIDVTVKYAKPYRDDVSFINQAKVTNSRGEQVRLMSVADMEWKRGYSTINRYNGNRTIKVFANVNTDVITSGQLTEKVKKFFKTVSERYPGYTLDFGGEREEQMKSVSSLLRATVIALLIIYLILGTLFKSFLQPLVVMSSIPFSFVGVVVGHKIMGEPIGILSLIGLAALTGIVVNDSLVMVDFINKARIRGAPRWLSVLRSAFVRFRPVVLTSLTTIFGLATLAFKTTGQAAFLAPMAISIVFGLVFSTILTLIIIPCAYAVLDDFLLRLFGKEAVKFHEREI
ncbi:MAG: efflux RND transporter permease subunit [Nitrospinota bacterium]